MSDIPAVRGSSGSDSLGEVCGNTPVKPLGPLAEIRPRVGREDWRLSVIAEARLWCGARFSMNACVPRKIVDCGRLPAEVYRAVGIVVPEMPRHWPRDFMFGSLADSEPYLSIVSQAFNEVESSEPGDLALFMPLRSRCFSHAAIIVRWPEVIHARGVGLYPQVEPGRADKWPLAGSQVKFFSPKF